MDDINKKEIICATLNEISRSFSDIELDNYNLKKDTLSSISIDDNMSYTDKFDQQNNNINHLKIDCNDLLFKFSSK